LEKVVVSSMLYDESSRCVQILRDYGFDVRLLGNQEFSDGFSTEEESINLLQGVSAVVAAGERYTENVFSSLPDLKVVARLGVGFDRVDTEAATKYGVAVTITPNANHESVAEHSMTLMLAVARRVLKLDRAVRERNWIREAGLPVRGSTLGIVGLGRIGRSLALRAIGMRMNVVATEPMPDREFVDRQGIKLLELDDLLGVSDFVSLNLPLSEKTTGLIDAGKIAKFKKGAVLVNSSRGGIVVESELAQALKSGHISGAGLDVFENELTDKENPLFDLDNVVLSPHVAGNDTLAIQNMSIDAAQYIIDLHEGKWPYEAVINGDVRTQWRW